MKKYCACSGQGQSPRNDRNASSKKCPTWTETFSKCKVKGHYSKSCNKCTACGTWGHRDSNSCFCSRQPASTNNHNTFNTEDELGYYTDQLGVTHLCITVDHHVYRGMLISRPSKPHPTAIVKLRPLPEEHITFGNDPPTSTLNHITIPMIADTGCHSSIIPFKTAETMGYEPKDVMPVKLSMRGAIKEDL